MKQSQPEIVSFTLDAFCQPLVPAVVEHVSELPLSDLPDFEVDALLQLLDVVEDDSSHVAFHPCKQEKVRRSQVRRVGRVGEELGVSVSEKICDNVCSMCRGSVMVQPKVLMSPHVWAVLSDRFTQFLHCCQVVLLVYTTPLRNKVSHDHTFAVPKNDEHDFAHISILADFVGSSLIAAQPRRCASLHQWFIEEPGFIPSDDSVLESGTSGEPPCQITSHSDPPLLLVIAEQMRNPLCGPFFQLQLVVQNIVDSPQTESSSA